MTSYNLAEEVARWREMAADLDVRSQQAARLAEILQQAVRDPAEIERERERQRAASAARGEGWFTKLFPRWPSADWARVYIENAAASAKREATRLSASAANFREIAEAIDADP